jgi:hypothetical protein
MSPSTSVTDHDHRNVIENVELTRCVNCEAFHNEKALIQALASHFIVPFEDTGVSWRYTRYTNSSTLIPQKVLKPLSIYLFSTSTASTFSKKNMTFRATALFLLAALAALLSQHCSGFSPSQLKSASPTRPSTFLQAGLFGASGKLGGLFGNDNKEQGGPKTILELAASDVKVGALRFLLSIYLVGEQNKPEPKAWLTQQTDDGSLNIYFMDGSAMISLDLQECSIKAVRHGEKPSLRYVLQESILLHGVLDELSALAFDVEAEQEKRLLRLQDASVIEKARETLPARKD